AGIDADGATGLVDDREPVVRLVVGQLLGAAPRVPLTVAVLGVLVLALDRVAVPDTFRFGQFGRPGTAGRRMRRTHDLGGLAERALGAEIVRDLPLVLEFRDRERPRTDHGVQLPLGVLHEEERGDTRRDQNEPCDPHVSLTPGPSRRPYSHSIVPGGLLVTSSTTLLTSATSLVMRVEMRSSTS